nr:MAG TPA: hypothetical protein [Caudoviricetes sp.]
MRHFWTQKTGKISKDTERLRFYQQYSFRKRKIKDRFPEMSTENREKWECTEVVPQ